LILFASVITEFEFFPHRGYAKVSISESIPTIFLWSQRSKIMYTLAIQREFIAQHYQTDEWDDQKKLKSFRYKAELMIEGDELDQQGYVVDFDELGTQLDGVIDEFCDQSLSELSDFDGLNPSIEHFCRILCEKMDDALYAPNVTAISMKLWEGDANWVAYDLERE
jgi:6-pyruvoyltetrahydropterin/6-carboxytetrahydropterin synthase